MYIYSKRRKITEDSLFQRRKKRKKNIPENNKTAFQVKT